MCVNAIAVLKLGSWSIVVAMVLPWCGPVCSIAAVVLRVSSTNSSFVAMQNPLEMRYIHPVAPGD